MTRSLILTFAILAVGCGSSLSSGSQAGGPPTPEASAAVRALRVRVLDAVAVAAEGDKDAKIHERMKAAVEAELGRAGLTVLQAQDSTSDLDVRLDLQVSGGLTTLHGHLELTASSGGTAVALAVTPHEIHRDREFPLIVAEKAVQALLQSPGLVEFAARKYPHPVAGGQEQPPAAADGKPSPKALATSKDHFNQGTRHYELAHFKEALAEYDAAYMAVPDPAYLFNIAQCHRKMGHDKEAVDFYKSYLRAAPNAPNRADVEKRIQELESGKRN